VFAADVISYLLLGLRGGGGASSSQSKRASAVIARFGFSLREKSDGDEITSCEQSLRSRAAIKRCMTERILCTGFSLSMLAW